MTPLTQLSAKEYVALVAKASEADALRDQLFTIREAVDVVLTNEEHAFSGGMRKYQKGSPTWQAYEDLRKAVQSSAAANNDWEKLTTEALERIRKAGYGEGGALWLCVPSKHGKNPDVLQGDYVGMAFFPASKEQHEAFKTDLEQLIPVSAVSHTIPFQLPAPPVLD